MNDNDRAHLVEQSQPFGVISEMRTVASNPIYVGQGNSTGALNEIANHGADHGPSFADQGIKAPHLDPFAPSGRAR